MVNNTLLYSKNIIELMNIHLQEFSENEIK